MTARTVSGACNVVAPVVTGLSGIVDGARLEDVMFRVAARRVAAQVRKIVLVKYPPFLLGQRHGSLKKLVTHAKFKVNHLSIFR